MHELPWITISGSRVRRFANDFHEWRSHDWKSLANRLRSDPKIVIHGNECIILFLTRYFMSWTYNYAKNNYRSLISPLSLRTAFSDLVLWRHHSWSVTSHERTALALWRLFADCCCTHKLAQKRSSLVNNSHEYRFLATRYSRLSMQEIPIPYT